MAAGIYDRYGVLATPPDKLGNKHWGDGRAGEMHSGRMEGYYAGGLTWLPIAIDANGQLQLALTTSDIQIGAVEIKDATGAQRAGVSAAGGLKVEPTDSTITWRIDAAAGALIPVGGNVASGATDSGNPVKVGGRYNATKPTLTDGQRGDLQLNSRGELATSLFVSGTPVGADIVGTEGYGPTAIGLVTSAFPQMKDPATGNTYLIRGDTTYGQDVDVARLPALPAGSNTIGSVNVASGQGKTLLFGTITQGAAGTTALVSADGTRKVKVVSYVVVMDAAGSFKFTDGTGDLSGVMPVAANGGVSAIGQPSAHLFETAAINRPFNIVTVTGKAFGHFSYYLEA